MPVIAKRPNENLLERRRLVVVEHLEVENAGNVDATLRTFARPRFEAMSTSETFDGEAEVRRHYEGRLRAFPDAVVEATAFHFAPGAVIVELVTRGTHVGEYDDIPANGNPYEVPAIAVFEFEDDRLICERSYFDRATLRTQLSAGASSQPESVDYGEQG